MMGGLTVSSAPAAPDTALALLPSLEKALELLGDAKAVAVRIKALNEAAKQSSALLESVRAESAALDQKRASHLATMTEERAAHDKRMTADRSAFQDECAATRAALADAEAKVKAAQKAADAEREKAVTLTATLEKRLKLMRAASAALEEA